MSIFNTACYRVDIQTQYSKKEHRVIIEEEIPEGNLYWKVLSTGNDYNSETITYQFKVVADE